jgi:hypothetical protein
MKKVCSAIFLATLLSWSVAYGAPQESSPSTSSAKQTPSAASNGEKKPEEPAPAASLPIYSNTLKEKPNGEVEWEPPAPKRFGSKERASECKKWEGKLISYYEEIYKVEKCKRRLITNSDLLRDLTRKQKVHQVKNETIAMLDEGRPIEDPESRFDKLNPKALCKQLEGKYATVGGDDIYLIEKCKRRLFPDWETFSEHRKKSRQQVIQELSQKEMESIAEGREVPSIMPEAFKKLLSSGRETDVIPLDEACKGVNNKYVSYYSKIYKIENCRKREVNPEYFLKNQSLTKRSLPELSSEQWLSLLDGKPLVTQEEKNRDKEEKKREQREVQAE